MAGGRGKEQGETGILRYKTVQYKRSCNHGVKKGGILYS